jgi:hypothetical protein
VGTTTEEKARLSFTFTIDTYVPIPPRTGRKPRCVWTPWPFAQMAVGHSFFVPFTEPCSRNASQAYGEFKRANPGTDFLMRTVERDQVTQLPGIRVWRTK